MGLFVSKEQDKTKQRKFEKFYPKSDTSGSIRSYSHEMLRVRRDLKDHVIPTLPATTGIVGGAIKIKVFQYSHLLSQPFQLLRGKDHHLKLLSYKILCEKIQSFAL